MFDEIDKALEHNISQIYFVDAVGGTGKTFVFNALLYKWRLENKNIVLAVASSGIAALLLAGGKTAQSRFGIPLKLMADSSCHVKSRSDLAKMLRYVQAIIWHEAPMMSKYAVECVDRLLR